MSHNQMFGTFTQNPLSIYFKGSCSDLLLFLSDIEVGNFPEEEHDDEIDYGDDEEDNDDY